MLKSRRISLLCQSAGCLLSFFGVVGGLLMFVWAAPVVGVVVCWDSPENVEHSWAFRGLWVILGYSTESLILAQDERWRRA